MRKNGWRLPFHPLQVVAITVFIAMVVAFYVLFVPLIGSTTMKYISISLYAPSAVVVIVLYAWCVGVNPADPGVLGSSMPGNIEGPPETSMLYCTLCKVEIFKKTRHCRICDKCVDGFDHHCQWLNNCVGKKNYRAFFGLMVGTIYMLVLLWSLGLWVLIHGFVSTRRFEKAIALRLSSGFPFVAYSSVVAFCTLLAMVATYPLGHLLIFHIVLFQKGLSTHDFIVAMRDLDQIQATQAALDSHGSGTSSGKTSTSSCTSSCTPPRIVFDHEQSIGQPEQFLSANVVESVSRSNEGERAKVPVKLSPWTLASLNKDDVLRSSMMSVSRSSVLRPVSSKNGLTSSSSGSHKDDDSRVCVKESVINDSTTIDVLEVHSQVSSDGIMKSSGAKIVGGSEVNSEGIITSSGAKSETLLPLKGDQVEAALDSTNKVLIGKVYVLSSDGSGVSSGSLHLRQDQLNMLGLRSSLTGWRWTQNPTFDAKLGDRAENSDEVVSLPCTPSRSTSAFALHRLSM